MKIGIICGKTGEEVLDKQLLKTIPKKYKLEGAIHTDVGLAYVMKNKFRDVDIDVIMPKDISNERLQKNDINIPIGYDLINAINDDPYVKKFHGKEGIDLLDKIFQLKANKIFPSYEYMAFLWDKKKYLQHLHKHKIPISPTIFVKDSVNSKKLLRQVQKCKWNKFIIKPIGGTIGLGFEKFNLSDLLGDITPLKEYFDENNEFYREYLVQELITGFIEHGEIKTFWIDGKFSYAIKVTEDHSKNIYRVSEIIDKKVINECIKIGNSVIKALPKISYNRKKVLPVMVRIDLTCCHKNKKFSPSNYFVNEIESDIAGTYINYKNIKYPALEVLADSYVKKMKELGIK
jgi:glutathione synthase/RimK-type ligase-like ATP-grasp enzyme